MARISRKSEITNHFDKLINRVNIHFEEQLEKYKGNRFLDENARTDIEDSEESYQKGYTLEFFDSHETFLINKYQEDDRLWSESTRVVDYLKQVQTRTVDELKKEMEDCLEYYESNTDKNLEELFDNKYCFQLAYTPINSMFSWFFDLYTVITDFYMTGSDMIELE